ncbi:hypothetical protein H5410_057013 [Solanum commersonii]|uniref:Uncharacterized protein n=1 Tax=Solanum commersonii TaxID=4109 RepID=A0A9J5WNW9_SOLCO|nr:hypothetical protein H5410_057013 [Solanum commersonii]
MVLFLIMMVRNANKLTSMIVKLDEKEKNVRKWGSRKLFNKHSAIGGSYIINYIAFEGVINRVLPGDRF